MTFGAVFPRVLRPAFGPGLASGAASNGLLNNLVAYWPLEADGTDATGRGNTLTNSGASFVAGKIGNGADLEASENDYLWRADNADLSAGDVDLTVSMWVKAESKTAYFASVGKFSGSYSTSEYALYYNQPADRFYFIVGKGSAPFGNAVANTFGSPPVDTWIFVVGRHDAVANTISISVNGGAVDTTAWSSGIADTTQRFDIGRLSNVLYSDGIIDEVGLWKSAPGGGGCLSAAQISALYSGGAGLAYSAFTT